MSSMSILTLWYLIFWNKALKSKYLRQTVLKRILEGSFGRLRSTARMRKALPWMNSRERIAKFSFIFLNCLPLRKLIPIIVNLGFFFDRMIEYSIALKSSPIKCGEVLLDIGPYYSCFPSYLAFHSYTIAIDINRDSMNFQNKVSKIMGRSISGRLECIVADATRLPFRDDAFDKIFVISTIEHIEKDDLVARESGKVLKKNGSCAISLPFSKSVKKTQIAPFFQRSYTRKMIQDRIIIPSLLSLEGFFTFSNTFVSLFYAAVPQGWFIFKDLVIGLALFKLEEIVSSKDKEGPLAIIELRKHF